MTELRLLSGSVHSAPEGMRATGPVPADEPIMVSVYFKAARPVPALTVLGTPVDAVSRSAIRASRETHHKADVGIVSTFASDNGLAVVHVDAARRLVQLKGRAADIETAFGTKLHRYEHDSAVIRGRSGGLHLPNALIDRVEAVLGLDTSPIATPKFVPHAGPNIPASFLPNEIAALYGFAGADASSQCIAIIELGGGYTAADNAVAFKAMGLPTPDIVAVAVDGGANSPSGGGGADGEVALDIQIAGGVAPNARLAVYFAPNTSQGFVDAISQAVHDQTNKPSVISISWGSPESNWSGQALAAMNTALQDAATVGVTVLAASGDGLATDGVADGKAHVDYPASNPYVLGCGGTRVDASASAITAETVWNSNGGGTGGGVSDLFALPAYQSAVHVPGGNLVKAARGVPDVSANADPDSGYRIVSGGTTGLIGGTSAASPLWAGLIAAANARRGAPLGFVHPLLYGNSALFHDIVQGDNRAGGVGYVAGPGWDPCSGLGSPTAGVRALLEQTVPGGQSADGPITDVNSLAIVSDAVASQVKAAAGITAASPIPATDDAALPIATKPGVERWPVKTGQDADRALVGKNIIAGHDLGAGIVVATIEELVTAARPADMSDPMKRYPAYQAKRAVPVETTIWRVDVTVIAMKLEADGDYHLVLQGASGEMMIAEVPTPTVAFVGDSPWLDNMRVARQAIDAKFVSPLVPAAFVMVNDVAVPRPSLPPGLATTAPPPSFLSPETTDITAAIVRFSTQLKPTRARITGVGFFDEVHGQTGVAQANGIELHPILKIEWF